MRMTIMTGTRPGTEHLEIRIPVISRFPPLAESPGFFLDFPGPWKALENSSGFGMFCKLKLNVLETPAT